MKRIKFILAIMLCVPLALFGQAADEFLEEAAEKNPAVQARYKAFEASLQKVAQAKGLPDPRISAGFFISPVETRVGPQRMRLSLSQMFPWFGTLDAKAEAAGERAQADYYDYVLAREKLFRQIRGLYFSIWETSRLIEIEKEYIAILETFEDLATTRLRTADGKLSDVYRVQLDVEESKTRLALLTDKLDPLLYNFRSLTESDASRQITIPDSLEMPPLPPSGPIADSSLSHPSVRRFHTLRNSARLQQTVVKKSRLPDIGVGLDYILTGKRDDVDIPDNGKDAIAPMLTVSLPIWSSIYDAQEKELELKQQEYDLMAESQVEELARDAAMIRYELLSERESIDLYQREIRLAEKTLGLIVSDYANDREEFEEILRLQQRILKYKEMIIRSKSRYMIEYADWIYNQIEI